MHRSARAVIALSAAGLLTAVAGCAGATTVPGASGTTPATLTNTPAASATASASSRGCLADVSVLYPGSDNPLRATCVHIGGTVTITLTASGGYRWMAPTSSAPAIAVVGAVRIDPNNTLHAVVTARASGTTTLSAYDYFFPDPNGPPSHRWTLTLTVEP